METTINFRAIVNEHREAHPDTHLYFLLDHAGLPTLMAMLKRCTMRWCSLFDDTRESDALAVAPILVFLGGRKGQAQGMFLDWIAQHGAYASAVTLLESPSEIENLQHRLVSRLDIKLSEDMDAILRFFDPRILAQLRTTLTPEQSLAFFNVAMRWWYVDRAGALVGFDTQYELKDGAAIPLVLSQEQEFALVDASEVDQVLALLDEEVPNLMREILPAKRYSSIAAGISSAKEDGLTSVIDLAIHVVTALSTKQNASSNLQN